MFDKINKFGFLKINKKCFLDVFGFWIFYIVLNISVIKKLFLYIKNVYVIEIF